MIHTHLDSGIFCVHSRRVSIRCFWTAFGPGRGRSRAARLGFCKCVKIWSKKKVQTINIIAWGGSTTWVREGGLSLNEFLAAIVLKWKFDHFRIEAEQPTPFPSPPSSDHLGTFQLFRGGPFPILGVYGCSSESRISQNAKRVTFKDWSSFRISYMKRDLFRSSPPLLLQGRFALMELLWSWEPRQISLLLVQWMPKEATWNNRRGSKMVLIFVWWKFDCTPIGRSGRNGSLGKVKFSNRRRPIFGLNGLV